eukprot:5591412-Amphidinium_carterae.1
MGGRFPSTSTKLAGFWCFGFCSPCFRLWSAGHACPHSCLCRPSLLLECEAVPCPQGGVA